MSRPGLAREADPLERVYEQLEEHAPPRVGRAIHWLRDPKAKPVRVPLGILCVAAGIVGPFVPVLGLEFIPLGLLLLAEDVPPLRKPVAGMSLWLHRQWRRIKDDAPPAGAHASEGIVHETRTRLRVRLAGTANELRAAGERMAAVQGVSSVRTSAAARCAVVQYDGSARTRKAVLARRRTPGR